MFDQDLLYHLIMIYKQMFFFFYFSGLNLMGNFLPVVYNWILIIHLDGGKTLILNVKKYDKNFFLKKYN